MRATWEELPDPTTRRARWAATLRRQPSAALLVVQLLVIVLLPLSEGSPQGRALISLLSLSAVVTAVFTVRSTPALTWLSVTLALPAAAFELWSLVDDRQSILFVAHSALAVFYFYTAYALVAYVFEDYWVTKDEFFAVAACFTVLVFAFAYVYLAVQDIYPSSFVSHDGPGQRTFLELLYLSGATLTAVGLSDVGPVQPQARTVVTIQQLGGVFYVAMVIARLVAMTVMRQRR